ncbi:MAG: family 43 glycosylhydrolase [Clostridiales bacterium]|jgi:hypothetical protein|nr:family 43 glycosylhydrolase [Clostridiales bacterium]
MAYACNPANISCAYQFIKQKSGNPRVSREAADPSVVLFKGKYLMFASMSAGFFWSEDLADWKFQPLSNFPAYDYAPDACVLGEELCLCASSKESSVFYLTSDPFEDSFRTIDSDFPFWDPHLFLDESDNGRLYLYWGCSAFDPLLAVELDRKTMKPIGEPVGVVSANRDLGFERFGENYQPLHSPEEREALLKQMDEEGLSEDQKKDRLPFIDSLPFIEGPWINKFGDLYYLQYAVPGSEFNTYADGVYVSESPLGPFRLADSNPFSLKPGGFITGAGHGSTFEDKYKNLWHIATMRISVNNNFERRVGLWRCGVDKDGELFCNQRYGDWVFKMPEGLDGPDGPESSKDLESSKDPENHKKPSDPWENPEWLLLSYGAKSSASSSQKSHPPGFAVDENIRTCWMAETAQPEWLEIDLGEPKAVHAIQVNFADGFLALPLPEGETFHGPEYISRWIDEKRQPTRYKLSVSEDGETYGTFFDKSSTETDLPHDLSISESGVQARYVRLEVFSVPYSQPPCVSGLRVFGKGNGSAPEAARDVKAIRAGDLDIDVSWKGSATGYVISWGHKQDKLYHSIQVFGQEARIGALVKGQETYVRVDSFNDSGITEGEVVKAH